MKFSLSIIVFALALLPQSPASFCPRLSPPSNGLVELSPTKRKATYTCNEGYSLIGYKIRLCGFGVWLGNPPQCAKDGQWTEWSTCSRTCGNGTQLRRRSCDNRRGRDCEKNASERRFCFVGGCLDSDAATRNLRATSRTCRRQCVPLAPPRNGSIRYENTSGAIYFCDKGFWLLGSSERRCAGCGGGTWTGEAPSCVGSPPESLIFLDSGHHVVQSHAFLMAAAVNTPAVRSVFFSYRIPSGKGSVSVRIQLQRLSDNTSVGTTDQLNFVGSEGSEFILSPACIQLTSDLPESYESKFQLDVSVPSGSTFEMRGIDTSQSDACTVKAGQCPDVSDQKPSRCGQYCRHDGSCSEEMKCCSTSCGVDCVLPVTSRIDASSRKARSAAQSNTSFMCNLSESSGDCGFKNSVCGSGTPWKLVHNNSQIPEHTLPFTASPGNECTLDVCIECIFPNLNAGGTTIPSFGSGRKRRSSAQVVGRSAFCLSPATELNFNWGTMPTTTVSSKNTKLEFYVDMFQGFDHPRHHMTVYLRCQSDDSVKINLGREVGDSYGAYHIPHFDNSGIHQKYTISDIHKRIQKQFYMGCPKYYVEFQVVVVNTPACVSSIFFTKD